MFMQRVPDSLARDPFMEGFVASTLFPNNTIPRFLQWGNAYTRYWPFDAIVSSSSPDIIQVFAWTEGEFRPGPPLVTYLIDKRSLNYIKGSLANVTLLGDSYANLLQETFAHSAQDTEYALFHAPNTPTIQVAALDFGSATFKTILEFPNSLEYPAASVVADPTHGASKLFVVTPGVDWNQRATSVPANLLVIDLNSASIVANISIGSCDGWSDTVFTSDFIYSPFTHEIVVVSYNVLYSIDVATGKCIPRLNISCPGFVYEKCYNGGVTPSWMGADLITLDPLDSVLYSFPSTEYVTYRDSCVFAVNLRSGKYETWTSPIVKRINQIWGAVVLFP
jgi:hypothetical protein